MRAAKCGLSWGTEAWAARQQLLLPAMGCPPGPPAVLFFCGVGLCYARGAAASTSRPGKALRMLRMALAAPTRQLYVLLGLRTVLAYLMELFGMVLSCSCSSAGTVCRSSMGCCGKRPCRLARGAQAQSPALVLPACCVIPGNVGN